MKIPCYVLPDYKQYIIIVLALLTLLAAVSQQGVDWMLILQVALAMAFAVIVDGIILKYRSKRWNFPSGAIISAMIIAMVVDPGDILLALSVVLLSLVLKHLIKPSFRNVFNPAALAIVVATLAFPLFWKPVSSVWWGAASVWTGILGLILVVLIKRFNTAISFLLTYIVLQTTIEAVKGASPPVTLQFLAGPIMYFAFFMVIEPVTTPTTNGGRILFGMCVAVLAFLSGFSSWLFANSFFLYLPLLFMNMIYRMLPKQVMG